MSKSNEVFETTILIQRKIYSEINEWKLFFRVFHEHSIHMQIHIQAHASRVKNIEILRSVDNMNLC